MCGSSMPVVPEEGAASGRDPRGGNAIMSGDHDLATAQDVAFYREHGWWVSDAILPEHLLEDLDYAIERYAAGERDCALPVPLLPQWTGAPERGLRQADYLSLQMDAAMDFVRHPLLPRLASLLSGAREIRLFHDQLVWKLPGGAEPLASVGWHTDRAYWRSSTSTRMLTAWVPLQDTTKEMGSLAVWDRSHLWPGTDSLHNFEKSNLGDIEKALTDRHPYAEIRVLPMRRGQVSFHHCRLIHGSYPNRTGHPRLAFAVHYQDGENRHAEAQNEGSAAVHLNDMLCRSGDNGQPDYTDPDVCPRLFPLEAQD